MLISYDGYGGYMIGKYYITEMYDEWVVRKNYDEEPEHKADTFQEAVDWCLDNQ